MEKILCVILSIFLTLTIGAQNNIETGIIFMPDEKYNEIGEASMPFGGMEPPSSTNLSLNMPPIQNQGIQNSCVAWALGYVYRTYLEKIKIGHSMFLSNGKPDFSKIFSPSFIYNQANNGANKPIGFVDAFNILIEKGICTWKSMPYKINDWTIQPNQKQINEAKNFRIETYRKLNKFDLVSEIKGQLLGENPVLIGMVIDKLYLLQGFQNHISPYILKDVGESINKIGHAVVIVGYDDQLNAFKFINSYGNKWGDDGFGWIDYAVVESAIWEAYIVKIPSTKYGLGIEYNPLEKTQNNLDSTDIFGFGLFVNAQTIEQVQINSSNDSTEKNINIKISGVIHLPANIGKYMQIVTYLYLNQNGQKGDQVKSTDYHFSLVNQGAAVATDTIFLSSNDSLNTIWQSVIPSEVLDLPNGHESNWGYIPTTTNLFAEPVIFLDGFPTRSGELISFSITR